MRTWVGPPPSNTVAAALNVWVFVETWSAAPARFCRRFNSTISLLSDCTDSPAICTLICPPESLSRCSVPVIDGGKFPSHCCHACTILTACGIDLLQVMPNLATMSTGLVRKLKLVTTPKFPLPPPRSAQNRSGFSWTLALRICPVASTTSIDRILSHASPNGRPSSPKPPPSEWPATPTGKQLPAGIAKRLGHRAL